VSARLLFAIAWLLAGLIGGLVLVAPWLPPELEGSGWGRLVRLFAEDALVRRTAIACAVGLAVTAHVFFLPAPKGETTEATEGGRGEADAS
jgi:hypothetical protein